MKKFFEKHSLGKSLGILFILSLILTWIIPAGSFNGSEYVETGLVRLGLTDFGNLVYYMLAMSIDKILYLLVLGAFYGILTKIPAYQQLVEKIAKGLKGKEVIFTVLISVFVAVLTSMSTMSLAVLLFVPFIINIILKMKLDKITAFVVTFGSMLVGSLGATFGSDGLTWFNYYITQQSAFNLLEVDMLYRVLILVVALLLFNFFTVIHVKKVLKDKVDESKEDLFEVETTKEKTRSLPLIIILAILAVITILGIIDWYGYFGIEVFNKFYEWLTTLTIGKDFTLIYYLLGSSLAPFGNQAETYPSWNMYSLIAVLVIFAIILIIVYKFNFSKIYDAVLSGLKKMGLVAFAVFCSYAVYITFYFSPMMATITSKLMPIEGKPEINIDYNGSGMAFFNIDTDGDLKADENKINQDTDKDGKCDLNCDSDGDGYPDKYLDFDGNGEIGESDEELLETFTSASILNYDTDQDGYADVNVDTDYNIGSNILSAFITSIFHSDLMYTGYSLSGYMISGFSAYLNIVVLIYLTMFGFVAFLAPTSILLVAGLTYTKVEYKNWLKYIWKFAVGMLLCLVVIYIMMFLL